jgi:hypothetical protein
MSWWKHKTLSSLLKGAVAAADFEGAMIRSGPKSKRSEVFGRWISSRWSNNWAGGWFIRKKEADSNLARKCPASRLLERSASKIDNKFKRRVEPHLREDILLIHVLTEHVDCQFTFVNLTLNSHTRFTLKMAPTEQTILSAFLLPPTPLPALISFKAFTALFPRSQQSSPQIRILYRDLQYQRAYITDVMTANIDIEVKRGNAQRRAVLRSRRATGKELQDDEVDVEAAVSFLPPSCVICVKYRRDLLIRDSCLGGPQIYQCRSRTH